MSARRHRIKATANLALVKRKPRKQELQVLATTDTTEPEIGQEQELEKQSEPEQQDVSVSAFKMPAASQLDDVFHSDIEDNVIQMDLQRTASGFPMSPSKAQARQRVRPTPVFGQRRNSFVGSPLAGDVDGSNLCDYPSPGTPTRRERYLSGSSATSSSALQQTSQSSPMPQSPYKYFPPVNSPGVGRIRTESSCSAFSDSGSPASGKQRKADGDKSQQPQQRVNARRDFETRFNKGVPDKSTFKMFDMIYYNPDSNPMDQKPTITTIKAESNSNADETKLTPEQLLVAKTEKVSAAAMPVPQLKLDANGEMILDEKTLEIETTAEVEARKVLANSSLILMDETTGNNGFYKRHQRTRGWSNDETVRFYRSLQIIGTDFSLMCEMFPQRTRRDLKLKYKKEERINGALINKALLYPKAFNIQELKDQLEQEERERLEAEIKWREVLAADAEVVQKRVKSQASKAARTLSDGDLVYENEHVTKQKLGKHAFAKRRSAMCAERANDENGTVSTKRKRRSRKAAEKQASAVADVKEESTIKAEQVQRNSQLQQELNDLLDEEEGNDVAVNDLHDTVADDAELIIPDAMALTPTTAVTDPDIEQILTELGQGSLVLVSSLDSEHEDRVVNEIYMFNKQTGDLYEEPLNIPDHIVQCILSVMS